MNDTSATTTTHQVTATRDLYTVIQVADLHHLPMPFVTRTWEHGGPIELQFRTRDEVLAWAEVLDVEIVDNFYAQADEADHVAGVRAQWMDIPLVLVATAPPVKREVA